MLEKRKAVRKILTHRQKFLSAVSRRYPQWLPFMKPVAVVARSGRRIPRGADECSGRFSGRHKWRPYVFPGDGVLPIVGATFMSPGWQAELCGNAVGAGGGLGVPFRRRAGIRGNAVGADGGSDVPFHQRASQVAPLRFPGDGVLPIVGATFMSPGWQAGLCVNAVGANGGSDVPFRRRASQVAPLRFFADKKVGRRYW